MGNQCGPCLGIPNKTSRPTDFKKGSKGRNHFYERTFDDECSCGTWQSRREAEYNFQREKIQMKLSRSERSSPVSYISETWLAESRSVAEAQRSAIDALLNGRDGSSEPKITLDLHRVADCCKQIVANKDISVNNENNSSTCGESRSSRDPMQVESTLDTVRRSSSEQSDSPRLNVVDISISLNVTYNHKIESECCLYTDSDHASDDESEPIVSHDITCSSGDLITAGDHTLSTDLNASSTDLSSVSICSASCGLGFSPYQERNMFPSVLASMPGRALFDKHDAIAASSPPNVLPPFISPISKPMPSPRAVDAASPELTMDTVRVLQALLGGAAGASVLVQRMAAGPAGRR
jgi:hypothetical protein